MKTSFNLKKNSHQILKVFLGASLLLVGVFSQSAFAKCTDADAVCTDYEKIAETATAAVSSVGGLAMVAFGASITPFIARIAMISIGKAFQVG